MAEKKWFPFFKQGKHTSSSGAEFNATSETLDKIIEMNKGREIPIAIGHPKTSSPAWGWVNDLKRTGELLSAKPKSLVAEFETMVKKGMFKNVSVSLNPDLTIRHIGFLGATPPAVEGLPAVEFAASEQETIVEFSMSEAYALQDVGSIFQRLREWLIDKFDLETADKVVSQWQIDNLKTVKPDDMPAQTSFSQSHKEEHMPKTVAELEAELAAERAKVAEFAKTGEKVKTLETELATERAKNQAAEFAAFCASEPMKKKASPVIAAAIVDFCQLLAGAETFEFSKVDDKGVTSKVKKAPVEAFKEFCQAHLPDIIEFGEVATKGKNGGTSGDVKTQRDAAEMEFSKAHPDMKYTDVVLAVSKEKPELYKDR